MTTSPKHESAGHALFERIVPAWREALPSTVPRDYFDRFVVRNRDALLRRFDTFAAQTGARPRASKEALAALAGRLGFMPKSVRVGDTIVSLKHTPGRGDVPAKLDLLRDGKTLKLSYAPHGEEREGPTFVRKQGAKDESCVR